MKLRSRPSPVVGPARPAVPRTHSPAPPVHRAPPVRTAAPSTAVAGHNFARLDVVDRTAQGSAAPDRRPRRDPAGSRLTPDRPRPASASRLDVLADEEGGPSAGGYIDQAAGGGGGAAAAAPAPATPAAAVGPAEPTQLYQLLTDWVPAADQYGFQVKFRCRSTSGNVQDLQDQAPNLIWRERVTYSRNDFSGRINPPDPTILPPGGVSFAPARTRRVGANLLEFRNITDTHWMPTDAVREGDFAAGPPPPGFIGPMQPPLPAVMESRQVYQFSANGGANWRLLAGSFIIRRTLFRDAAGLHFRTQKTGVHTVTEPYKP